MRDFSSCFLFLILPFFLQFFFNLAKVLKGQMELRGKRAELLKQIRATTDEKQKKTLTTELEQIVGQQFDLIVKRKQEP